MNSAVARHDSLLRPCTSAYVKSQPIGPTSFGPMLARQVESFTSRGCDCTTQWSMSRALPPSFRNRGRSGVLDLRNYGKADVQAKGAKDLYEPRYAELA